MIPAAAKIALDFIASKEAPRGYDTVYGNRMSRMPKPLTSMTINEVIAQGAWRTKQFGSSACGRYQFMKATLEGLVSAGRARGDERMTPDVQDRLGYELLIRRGYKRFMAGSMSAVDFGNQIAMEWASFPVLSAINGKRRGQSYYAGDGQNHALVAPEPVEDMLERMLTTAASPAVSAPRTATVSAAAVAAPWWQRALGIGKARSVAAKPRPGLHPGGSADLWDVQAALKERGYYNTGLLDGLDGSRTQAAVAQIRKDNGLGDGGIDAEFLAGLPTWPHIAISTERATMSFSEAEEHAPEILKPNKLLTYVGAGLFGTGTVDQFSGAISKFNDGAGQVQTAFGAIASAVAFLAEHKILILWGFGAFLLYKGVMGFLKGVVIVRQALR